MGVAFPSTDTITSAGCSFPAALLPSSITLTMTSLRSACARMSIRPPSGEYLNAFSSSWLTMLSVAPWSPCAAGRSPEMSVARTCRSDSGRNTVAACVSTAARSNGSLLTVSRFAPAREPSSSWSTSLARDSARSAIGWTAVRRAEGGRLSQRAPRGPAKAVATALNAVAGDFVTSESGGKGQILDGDPSYVTND